MNKIESFSNKCYQIKEKNIFVKCFKSKERFERELSVIEYLSCIQDKGFLSPVLLEVDKCNLKILTKWVEGTRGDLLSESEQSFNINYAKVLFDFGSSVKNVSQSEIRFRNRIVKGTDKEIVPWNLFFSKRVEAWRKVLKENEKDVYSSYDSLISVILRQLESESDSDYCMIHYDFNLKNILIAKEAVFLYDFESVSFGNPIVDVSKFIFSSNIINSTAGEGFLNEWNKLSDRKIEKELALNYVRLHAIAAIVWCHLNGNKKFDNDYYYRSKELFCREEIVL